MGILCCFICIVIWTELISCMAAEETSSITEEAVITSFTKRDLETKKNFYYKMDVPKTTSKELIMEGKYGTPATATRGIIGDDGRYTATDTGIFPNRFILYMETTWPNNKKTVGTGWMFGASTVVTVAHNVYDSANGGWAEKILVWPGRNGNTAPFGNDRVIEYHLPTAYTNAENRKYDVALLKLSTNLGEKTGYFGVKYSPTSYLNENVYVSGYPAERGKKLYKMDGIIHKVTQSQIYYEIDTENGQSGSPVYLGNGSNRYCVGIHSGQRTTENVGIRITRCIFEWLKVHRT